jgi:hypothetical protein
MSTIDIRAARAADHDAWLPLWRGHQAFYRVDTQAMKLFDRIADKPGFVQYRNAL